MVSCREFVGLFLDAWNARELPTRRQHECDAHHAACAECRRYVAEYSRMIDGLRSDFARAADEPLPEDLVQAVLQKVTGAA